MIQCCSLSVLFLIKIISMLPSINQCWLSSLQHPILTQAVGATLIFLHQFREKLRLLAFTHRGLVLRSIHGPAKFILKKICNYNIVKPFFCEKYIKTFPFIPKVKGSELVKNFVEISYGLVRVWASEYSPLDSTWYKTMLGTPLGFLQMVRVLGRGVVNSGMKLSWDIP